MISILHFLSTGSANKGNTVLCAYSSENHIKTNLLLNNKLFWGHKMADCLCVWNCLQLSTVWGGIISSGLAQCAYFSTLLHRNLLLNVFLETKILETIKQFLSFLISVEIEFQHIPEELVTRPDQSTRPDQTKLPHHTTTESINVPQKDIYTYKHICNNIYLVISRFKSRWTKKRGSLGTTWTMRWSWLNF